MKKVAAERKKSNIVRSEVHKQNLSDSLIRYYNNKDRNSTECRRKKHSEIMSKVNGRKINQFTLDGKFVGSYDTIKKAGLDNKLSYRAITHNLAGRSKQSQGFIWKYAD
jgi:hypothetical protein